MLHNISSHTKCSTHQLNQSLQAVLIFIIITSNSPLSYSNFLPYSLRCLPVHIDVGTNRKEYRDDPKVLCSIILHCTHALLYCIALHCTHLTSCHCILHTYSTWVCVKRETDHQHMESSSKSSSMPATINTAEKYSCRWMPYNPPSSLIFSSLLSFLISLLLSYLFFSLLSSPFSYIFLHFLISSYISLSLLL